jgi:predicted adenylyl cyclase CyaB
MNYDIKITAKIIDYLRTKEAVERISGFHCSENSEIIHFSAQPIDYDNILSDDKFRVRIKNNESIVRFRKQIKDPIKGVALSEEREFILNDFENFESLMEALKIVIFAREIKNSSSYRYKHDKNVIVKLVNIDDLGAFLEIDFPCNTEHDKEFAHLKVQKILEDLEISHDQIQNKFYLQLLIEKEKQKYGG